MKNKIIVLVFLSLVIPQFALASWWNPFTWSIFSRTKISLPQEQAVVPTPSVQNVISVPEVVVSSSTSQAPETSTVEIKKTTPIVAPKTAVAPKIPVATSLSKPPVITPTTTTVPASISQSLAPGTANEYATTSKSYDSISSLVSANGKLGFIAKDHGKYSLVYDGVLLKSGNTAMTQLTAVNNKLAYTYSSVEHYVGHIIYDGKDVGKEYGYAFSPIDVGGKLSFSVGEAGQNQFLVIDGKEFGKEYDNAAHPASINGKLAYTAFKGFKKIVVYDGKELEYGDMNTPNTYPIEVGGKLAYSIFQGKKQYIILDGKEIGKEYETVTSPISVGGKLGYIAVKDKKVFIVLDGKELTMKFPLIGEKIMEVNGKLAYLSGSSSHYYIIYDGKEVGKEYDTAYAPVGVSGKLAFVATKGGKSFVVVEK